MDRFALKFSLGYITAADETAMLADQTTSHPLNRVSPCISREDLLWLKNRHIGSIFARSYNDTVSISPVLHARLKVFDLEQAHVVPWP